MLVGGKLACQTPLKPLSEGQLSSDAAEDRPESKTTVSAWGPP